MAGVHACHRHLRLWTGDCPPVRVFGKWSALDIIVSIMVGSNLSRALTGSAPLVGTLAATTLLMALHWVLAQLAARDRSTMLWDSISEHDLQEALREHGVNNLGATRLVMCWKRAGK